MGCPLLKYNYSLHYPRGSNYHSSPMCQGHVIIIFKSPAYSSITNAFLSLLQFFKQTEVTWNNCKEAIIEQHIKIQTLPQYSACMNRKTCTRKYKCIQ